MSELSFAAVAVIAINTMNGPGLTTLPSVANAAGIVPFVIMVIVAVFVASFVVARLARVMWLSSCISDSDDAENDDKIEVEVLLNSSVDSKSTKQHAPTLKESDIVALSHRLFAQKRIAACAMVGCALSLALAQMMLCAAITDSMIVASLGRSCGVSLGGIYCTSHLSMKPFQVSPDNPTSIISAGILISSSITISLASVDLDSMITAQYALFGCLLVACTQFLVTFRERDGPFVLQKLEEQEVVTEQPSWVGEHPFDAVGPILFNFAFIVTAPPLICSHFNQESATQALIIACVVMGVLYTIIGTAGSEAARSHPEDDNLLSLILRSNKDSDAISPMKIGAVVLFGLSQLAAIPVYCELVRETLITHLQVIRKRHAFLISHVLPWLVVAITYNSALFEAFVEWSSLLILGFANFSFPLLLDYAYTQQMLRADQGKLHMQHTISCPSGVAFTLVIITAGITAVIVQRLTNSILLAEFSFIGTTMVMYFISHTRSGKSF